MAKGYYLTFDSNAKQWALQTKRQIRSVGEEYDKLGGKLGGNINGNDIRGIPGITKKLSNFGAGALLGGVNQLVSAFKTAVPLMGSLAGSFIAANAELQKLSIRMETAAGGVDEGLKQFEKVIERSYTTPFNIEAIADSTAKLLAASLDPDMVDDWMTHLTDAIAAFGGGGENLRYATIALFQMVAKGNRIFMEELRRQLAEQVPTAFPALAKSMDMTMEELFIAIENGEVEAIKNITGMFDEMHKLHGGAAAKLMQTWDGQIIRVQSLWKVFMKQIGDAHGSFESMTGVIRAIGDALQNLMVNPEMKAVIDNMGESLTKFFENFSDPRMFEMLIQNAAETIDKIFEMLSGLGEVIAMLVSKTDSLSGKVNKSDARRLGVDLREMDPAKYFELRSVFKELTDISKDLGKIPLGAMLASQTDLIKKHGEDNAEQIKKALQLAIELKETLGQDVSISTAKEGTLYYELLLDHAAKKHEEMAKDRVAANARALKQMVEDEKEYFRMKRGPGSDGLMSAEEIKNAYKEVDMAAANVALGRDYSSELEQAEAMAALWKEISEDKGKENFTYPLAEMQKWLDKVKELQAAEDAIDTTKLKQDLDEATKETTVPIDVDTSELEKVEAPEISAAVIPELDPEIWSQVNARIQELVTEVCIPIKPCEESVADFQGSAGVDVMEGGELVDMAGSDTDFLEFDVKLNADLDALEASMDSALEQEWAPIKTSFDVPDDLEVSAKINLEAPEEGSVDWLALDEMMFEDAFDELRWLIDEFDNIEPTDLNLEMAEKEIQDLAAALKQVQFDDQITSTDLARAQDLIDMWFEIVAAQSETGGYAFPVEEWDKARDHLKMLLGDLSEGYEFPMKPRLDDAAWDDLFAKLDERISYFDSMDTDMEFETAEQDISKMVNILTQLSELEIISEGDLGKAAELVDYFKRIVQESGEGPGYEFPEEELAKVEAHYNRILALFQEQAKVRIDPALDEMMWDDAFSELDQMLADFGTMSTDIDLETTEAEIQKLSVALKDLQFGDSVTDTDVQRARWLVDYWKQLTESPGDLEGYALPTEELEKAEKHLEKLILLRAELNTQAAPLMDLQGSFGDDFLEGGMVDDEFSIPVKPEVEEGTWIDLFKEMEAIVDNYGSELELNFGDHDDIRKLGDELRDVDFSKQLSQNDLNKAKTLVNYWKEIVQQQRVAGVGYAFPGTELAASEEHLTRITKAYEDAKLAANSFNAAKENLKDVAETIPVVSDDSLEKQAALLVAIEEVQREVSMLESIYSSTTATWIDDTQNRIRIVEDLISSMERLGEVSAAIPSFNDADGIPGRYAGGPVSSGRPYVVGERGPELFVPSNSGNIVPNNQLGGSGDTTEVYFNFNQKRVGPFQGSRRLAQEVLREIETMQGALS